MEAVIVRAPLVYGPEVKGNFLRLMRLVDRRLPLPFGAVANRRSLIARANLASALSLGLEHGAAAGRTFLVADRSEEHTSGLQSLMRISYAVSCLTKTKPNTHDK